MKIYSQQNNISFTSTRIGEVNLFKIRHGKKVGMEKAYLTLLNDKDNIDANTVRLVQDLWVKNSKKLPENDAHLVKMEIKGICENFLMFHNVHLGKNEFPSNYDLNQQRLFLVIESEGKPSLEKRIIGFIKLRDIRENQGKMECSFLVVNPLQMAKYKKRKFGGIGESLFAKAIQIGLNGNFSNFSWKSDNNSYYSNILKNAAINLRDLDSGNGFYFSLPKKLFKSFLDYFDKKYNMNFSSTPVEQILSGFKAKK